MVEEFISSEIPGSSTSDSTTGSTTGSAGVVNEINQPTLIYEEITEGSTSLTYQPIAFSNLLSYLSNSSKSKILSASNIGSATISIIQKSLETIDKLDSLTTYLIDDTILNSLAISAHSRAIQIANLGISAYARVIINISEPFTPLASSPKLSIKNGNVIYHVNLDFSNSARKIIFNNIPALFCSNFSVINNTGTTLPSFGNSILVQGL